ncbi:hypothetical protein BLNAU_3290 [Blattamonas nauphoetae]|uniref:Uncharacterized protein n=1 Tax=Blattamonas nauphoetae TaxID=2049346 RepID=A0ABQ9YDU2_9EUKA|nr:hypothetical protein BLNAU_3290 [Blattamonas nauphoetae]
MRNRPRPNRRPSHRASPTQRRNKTTTTNNKCFPMFSGRASKKVTLSDAKRASSRESRKVQVSNRVEQAEHSNTSRLQSLIWHSKHQFICVTVQIWHFFVDGSGFSIVWLPLNHRSNQRQVHTRLGEDFRWAEQPLQSFAVRHVHTLSRVSPLRPTKATLACISNMDTFASSTDARDAVNAAIKLKQSSKQLQQHPKFDEMEFRHSFPVQRDGRSQVRVTAPQTDTRPFLSISTQAVTPGHTHSVHRQYPVGGGEGQVTDLTNTLHDEEDDENFDPMYGIRQFSLLKSFCGRDSEREERPADDKAIHPSTRLKMHIEEVDLVSAMQAVCMIADLLLKDDTVTFDDTSRSGQPPRSPKLPHRLLQPPHTVPCRALSYLRPPPLSSARQDQKSGEQHQTSMDESGLVHFALSALRFGVTAELCDDKARIDDYNFDEKLLQKASKYLSLICWALERSFTIDAFLVAIGQDSANPAAVETLAIVHECLIFCSPSNRLTLFSSGLIPGLLSTPRLRDLSGIDDQNVMTDIRAIFDIGVLLSSANSIHSLSATSDTDPESIRDVVLNDVLIPFEPSLVQITRNPHLLSWNDEYRGTLLLLLQICDRSAFHQPTLDFICSSHFQMTFQSLLSTMENEETHQFIIWKTNDIINIWKKDGAETWRRGRILLQTLEQEGFFDGLEQTLLLDKSSVYGEDARVYSFILRKALGMNSLQPQ